MHLECQVAPDLPPCRGLSHSLRRDTLARHVATHGTGAEGILGRTRGANACLPCSRDKVKCSGEAPCGRCQSKGRNCTYRARERNSGMRSSQSDQSISARCTWSSDRNFPPVCESVNGDHQAVATSPAMTEIPPESTDLEYSANCAPSHQDDLINCPTVGSVPLFPDVDFGFPWTLEYADALHNPSLCDHQLLLDLGVQYPCSPLPSTPNTANAQDEHLDLRHSPHPTRGRARGGSIGEKRQCRGSNTIQPSIMEATDEDITAAETFCHVRAQLGDQFEAILAGYETHLDGRFKDTPFPNRTAFNSFIQLYYEYFDRQLCFIHPSALEQPDVPWILVLAVASVGCQYTKLARKEQYATMLMELLRVSLPMDAMKAKSYDIIVLAQCSLLAVVNLMFTGFKDNIINLQIQRAWLATLESGGFISLIIARHTKLTRAFASNRLCFPFRMYFGTHGTDLNGGTFRSRAPVSEDGLQSQNLKELFSMPPTPRDSSNKMSEIGKLSQLLMLFVEEKRVIAASQSSILRDFTDDDQIPSPIVKPLSYAALNQRYESLRPAVSTVKLTPCISDTRDTFFNLLFILRHIPLGRLYTYSGWYASEPDISAARSYLTTWLRENPMLARECVVHAGALLGKVRSSAVSSCYDPFCLLIAVLYLWMFERLRSASCVELPQPPETSGRVTMLKVDQYCEERTKKRWVEGDSSVVLHITGVGLLSSPGGTRRLLQEFLRIISSRTAWSVLRRGLVACVGELLNDLAPITATQQLVHS
ncbi:hypothetical protein P170DRAFT_460272 [Aspergillus steynii IBT 23096]|uniref:Zn(2)-C6 fungal-type domain-containing protein n=1 Tax=Aspergillus steynii IBT 23096 TaxID=1392250 RepID=A0A2I2GM97_9EURO|nr:uncharacterized protein P170DRAFT_460272 [Aspergillus steynii IBT 23096]PLB53994.1 hypothetical protein P170DRAFT_460272 [Aspergillus steynii IBT 23096]